MSRFATLRTRSLTVAAAAVLATVGSSASAAVLYSETFDDETTEGTSEVQNGSVIGGEAVFTDDSTSQKSAFTVAQNFTAPVMTFSFDVVAPVTIDPNSADGSPNNDLLFRAGTGTGLDMLGSSNDLLEQILFRDTNRTGYSNTGNESVFVVSNASGSPITFTSPVDDTTAVTLADLEYAAYVRDNDTGAFSQARGPSAFGDGNGADAGLGTIERFSIGNSSNSYEGGVSIDNVGVVDEVSFQTVPEPTSLALLGGAGALLLARRRR